MDDLAEQIRMRLDRLPCPDPCACGPCLCAKEIADLVRTAVISPETLGEMRKLARTAIAQRDRLRAALDKITKQPDTHRLVMQIALEALEGREG